MKIEKWSNQEKKDPTECEVVVNIGSDRGCKVASAILTELGEVNKVVHYRRSTPIDYTTYFYANGYTVAVIGAFTSGYLGGGTNRFKRVLIEFGFPEDEVSAILLDGSLEDAIITLEK